jgi:hypothetical protein
MKKLLYTVTGFLAALTFSGFALATTAYAGDGSAGFPPTPMTVNGNTVL